ncbi:uncharacterized protein LOC122041253 isoform X4 [Zingiber officinale]|uniref:uncharacterized protein LOC122041253 isoform X4 n=1 Tax=Zingiber officinale TaxID=94328 RepID=UPI001C4B8829|nr:uncharacterized protein LOC122041253 isoform X4 [Zingiber officinale]
MWKGFLGFFTITIIPGRKRGSSGSFGFARASNTAMLSSLPALAFASEGEGFRWMKSLRPFSPPGKPPVRPKSSFSKVPSSTSTAEGGAGAGGEARGGEGGYSMVVCWSLWWMPRSPLQRSKRSIKERLHGDLGEDFNRSNVVSAKRKPRAMLRRMVFFSWKLMLKQQSMSTIYSMKLGFASLAGALVENKAIRSIHLKLIRLTHT